jgi:uncharacterized membrane protein
VTELGSLLLGTVIYRPYVYIFFVCYLFFALGHLKLKGTLIYTIVAYFIAYASEYSATRNGFPFGMYVYLDSTRTRELWISNVPFWDSLSFVFLSYFSWILAQALLRPRGSCRISWVVTSFLGGLLMMLLDVVIDPLTLLGDRWFLGKIYFYPDGGSYFGVTFSNFVGWFFVGTVTLLVFQGLVNPKSWRPLLQWPQWKVWSAYGVYAGVLIFQLTVTAWIGEWVLLVASTVVASLVLIPSFFKLRGAEA